jgi:DNA polymerase III delta prime subunit
MVLLEKYVPEVTDNIVGNRKNVLSILKWLKDFKEGKTDKQVMIINGESGLGKSLIGKLSLQESGYRVNNINLNNIVELGKLYERIEVSMTSRNIFTMVYKQSPISLMIDDIDNIHVNTNRNFIVEFTNILKSLKTDIPVICTCKYHSLKKLSSLGNVCNIIELKKPSNSELIKFIKMIITKEHIKIKPECFQPIINHSDHDIRKLLILLEDISKIHDGIITLESIQSMFKSIAKKDVDEPLFNLTKYFLQDNITFENASIYYNLDRYMLPYMMHENYIHTIMGKNTYIDNKLRALVQCSNSLSDGNQFQNYSLRNNNWSIDEYNCTLSCKFINNELNNLENTLDTRGNVKTHDLKYTIMYNKISLHSTNYRYFISIKEKVNLSSDEVYYLSILIYNYLYVMINHQKVIIVLKYYKLHIDDIPLLLKIYKLGSLSTIETKKLTASIKKELLRMFL